MNFALIEMLTHLKIIMMALHRDDTIDRHQVFSILWIETKKYLLVEKVLGMGPSAILKEAFERSPRIKSKQS